MNDSALILFAHGARDPRWVAPFERLRDLIAGERPDLTVRLGFLELMSPRLPELVDELIASGRTRLTLVPVFLGQGGHVLRDLPAMVQTLKEKYPDLALNVAQAVGENQAVLEAMAAYSLSVLEPVAGR